ncbi:dihydrodipicolinate reductase C-terminal domain-containing protein [Microvirga aerilata]|uniref:dihydrodipicolinate reductase C-terminal domain-containing protein n=1 Tax=Microvirga aerilata TaxID=670292 RepID=UPI0036323833
MVVGTSGLSAEDYADIDRHAQQAGRGVLAAGNFSITATLLRRFALEAARFVPDVEVIDYASAKKPDTPSGTARELAELLSEARQAATSKPVEELTGVRETRAAPLAQGSRCRFTRCACRPSSCPARPCSGPTTNAS